MLLSGKTRENLTAQVREAATRIGTATMTALAIAVCAVALAAGALLVSLRALKAVA